MNEIHIGQYVVTGTRRLLTAVEAIRRATTWKCHRWKTEPRLTVRGDKCRVSLRTLADDIPDPDLETPDCIFFKKQAY